VDVTQNLISVRCLVFSFNCSVSVPSLYAEEDGHVEINPGIYAEFVNVHGIVCSILVFWLLSKHNLKKKKLIF